MLNPIVNQSSIKLYSYGVPCISFFLTFWRLAFFNQGCPPVGAQKRSSPTGDRLGMLHQSTRRGAGFPFAFWRFGSSERRKHVRKPGAHWAAGGSW